MEKIANRIVLILVREKLIEESMLEIYQYGLVRMLELGGAVLTGFLICLGMGMMKEGIIFFAFFMPLRSFLGGFHLKKYWECYIMSCFTLFIVLTIARFVSLDVRVSLILILLASVQIAVEAKKEREKPENKVYALIVWAVLGILLATAAFCVVRKQETILVLLCCVTLIVLIGKVFDRVLQNKNEV